LKNTFIYLKLLLIKYKEHILTYIYLSNIFRLLRR